jgi:hypothetical protein
MKYSRNKDIVARSVAGEHLLVPVKGCTKKLYTLNKVGSQLWELIETSKTELELVDALVERYQISPETALKDVQLYLDELVRMELVRTE